MNRTTLDVETCPYCDAKHTVPLLYFARPPRIYDIVLTAWALCPSTGEPILVTVSDHAAPIDE